MEKNNELIFTRVRDVQLPKRANQHDAGIDFFCPVLDSELIQRINEINNSKNVIITPDFILVASGADITIPSGVKVWIMNKESALVAANKSGLATKFSIQFTAQVIDADYTGEIHIGIRNHGKDFFMIKPGAKLIQFLHLPIILSDIIEVGNDGYNDIVDGKSDRGEGGFGSTGF